MHHFEYRGGVLHAEDVSLEAVAERVGTPFYCYSTATLERHYRVFDAAFDGLDRLVCFALKANSNLAVLRTLARLGAGMDVVSEGELRRALAAGVPPERIVFSGVGKTQSEMALALECGIYGFNVESEPELRALSAVTERIGRVARIALRVNPDVDARTHHKISTGKAEHKFGVAYAEAPELYRLAATLPGLNPAGVHVHIGSQICALAPFEEAFHRAAELVRRLRADGFHISFLNFGGGLGVPYRPDDAPPSPQEYAAVARRAAEGLDCRLVFEPGRMIAGNAGVLVARVIYVKQSGAKRFVILDAAMNDLIRPTLYDAHHEVRAVVEARAAQPWIEQDFVGPVCETGDFLAKNRIAPPFEPGDLTAFMTAGAYGAVQSNAYNSRLLAPEVIVNGAEFFVAKPRPSYEQMLAAERTPPWLMQS
ncbi:MAG: diaminopimelate decarboxylase [Hyphomicrobiales bacterium]|nr:diaminopimelate decarboxylase [Hyphomicrobiales bacterium]